MCSSFDEVLFRSCYWNFISLTTLSEDACEQALEELVQAEILDARSMNKALRKWFQGESGIQWKDPQHAYRVGGEIRDKPRTEIQQIDVIAHAVVDLYFFEVRFRKSIKDGVDIGIDRKAYVEARFDCPYHINDLEKLVSPSSYVQHKPFRRDLDCHCWLRWESLRPIRKAQRAEAARRGNQGESDEE